MKFTISRALPQKFKCDIIALGCYERLREEGDALGARPFLIKHADGGIALDKALGGTLSKQIATEKFVGERGSSRLLFTAGRIPAKFILLVGLGSREKFDLETLREAGGRIAKAAREVRATSAALVLEQGAVGTSLDDSAGLDTAASRAGAISEGVLLGSYSYDRYKSEKKATTHTTTTFLYQGDATPIRKSIEGAEILALSIKLCRDLVNAPGSELTPTILAQRAKEIAAERGFSCSVWGSDRLKKEKMEGLITVGRGSVEPSVFIILTYKPKEKARGKIAFVGKGVTFDSGGISIKPALGMEKMKNDMAGAAAALGAIAAIAALELPIEVSVYIPSVENMPDAQAVKPGDIYTARNGKTIEVVNTDAEGRLILADALSYAADQKPDAMLDLATLTGGAAYVCGEIYTPFMGNDQKLLDKIKRAGETAGELLWQLPLPEAYKKGYTSGIADLNNTGKGKAQTILAGIFLKEFVGKTPWAHFDIAYSSWTDEETALGTRGGTGAMVRTLVSFAANFKKSGAD